MKQGTRDQIGGRRIASRSNRHFRPLHPPGFVSIRADSCPFVCQRSPASATRCIGVNGTKLDKIPPNPTLKNIFFDEKKRYRRSNNAGKNGGSGGARTRNLCRDRAAL